MHYVKHMQYLRIKKGLSRFELAVRINRNYDTIKNWEIGITPIPKDMLIRLKKHLDIPDQVKFKPTERIEISNEEYKKYRKYFRQGPVERVSPTMLYFLGNHYPIKSLSEVAERIQNKKRLTHSS